MEGRAFRRLVRIALKNQYNNFFESSATGQLRGREEGRTERRQAREPAPSPDQRKKGSALCFTLSSDCSPTLRELQQGLILDQVRDVQSSSLSRKRSDLRLTRIVRPSLSPPRSIPPTPARTSGSFSAPARRNGQRERGRRRGGGKGSSRSRVSMAERGLEAGRLNLRRAVFEVRS